jgi:hypothetical protein
MERVSHTVRADKDCEVYWRGAAQAIKIRTEVTVLLGKTDPEVPVLAQRTTIGRGRFDPV